MAVPPPSPSPAETLNAKKGVRARLRRARRDHIARLTAQGGYDAALEALCARVLAHVPAGAIVALYQAYGGEIDPAPIARELMARGHHLAMPHVAGDKTTMRFLAWTPDQALIEGAYGLRQPDEASEEIVPSLIVTPLVGFDRRGGRIGQGAGYYDRAFARLPGAMRIGLAWSAQEVAALPLDPWDVPLHAVATEQEWIVIGGTRP